jgi:hypothetical protein
VLSWVPYVVWVARGGGFGRWLWDVLKVFRYRSTRLLLLHGKVFSKEFAVAQCDSARTIHPYDVLIELSHFYDEACLVPFGGMWASLILDSYINSDSAGW